MKETRALFEGCASVGAEALLVTREGDEVGLAEAFEENVRYIVERNFAEANLDIPVCTEQCQPPAIVVQFKEKGYDHNVVQRVFTGGKLRGTLYYVDRASATVLAEESLEQAETYGDLLRLIHLSVGARVAKMLAATGRATGRATDVERYHERVEKVDPIKPKYAELFQSS